ncbi:MAG: DNA polymerase III subunit gamma/tau [Clostridia bacterium]|nr:DNA polymerase III subunit gamma/tau [Clostridia bacterium]
MYTALYRACRPEVFEEILGQEHIVRILKNQVATDTVSHAYLFCGTRGTGKTTTARILAKAVNCTADGDRPCGVCDNCRAIKEGSFMDVIEIDAASNNGVDNIRELRESVKYPPAVGRKKVYIIDEVHMLSSGAFNALLKTLEEPPENVMFILATTEPQKLLATITSRCMRLDFRRVSEKLLCGGMTEICAERGIEAAEDALRLIAVNADGSVRDALSILDQCISAGQKHITREDVLEFLGTAGEEVFTELTYDIISHNSSEALLLLGKVLADGKDVRQFMRDWLSHYRNLLVVKFLKNPEDILNMSSENASRLREQSDRIDLPELNDAILELSKTIADAKWSAQPRILLELCIVKLASGFAAAPMRISPSVNAAANPQAKETAAAAMKKTAADVTARSVHTAVSAEENSGLTGRPENARSDEGKTGASAGTDADSQTAEGAGASAASVRYSKAELEELWHNVFETGEASKASFNIVRKKTRLTEISDGFFKVVTDSELAFDYIKNNREMLESIMAQITGAQRHLECVLAGENEAVAPNSELTTENIAANLQNILGVDVKIE